MRSPRLTTADDHALAHDLAERAGRLLLDLRAQGGDPAALKDAGDRSSHEFLMAELAKARPADAVLSEEGIDRQGPPHRRPSLDRRPPRRHPRVRRAGPPRLGSPRRPLGARAAPGNAGAAGELTAGAVALPAQGITLSTLNAAERADRRGDSRRPSAGVPAGTSPSGSGAQRPLRMVVSRTRASQLVKDVAAILNADLVPCGAPAPRPPRSSQARTTSTCTPAVSTSGTPPPRSRSPAQPACTSRASTAAMSPTTRRTPTCRIS